MKGREPTLFKAGSRKRPTLDGKAKYRLLKRISEACSQQSVPPLDERLKSIIATQIGNLLRGGWDEDEIGHVAVELALKYDRFHQHESMLGLQRVMELRDEDRALLRHKQRMKAAAGPVDLRVAKILGPVGKRDPHQLPGNHRFDNDGAGACTVCRGPVGVHVTFTDIPELEREALDELARARELRRPMRAIGE